MKTMWEQQLASMLEADQMNPMETNDLCVTYAAEMGDESLFEALTFLKLESVMTPPHHWSGSASSHRRNSISGRVGRSVSISYGRNDDEISFCNRSKSSSTFMSWAGGRRGYRAWSTSMRT